MAAWQQAAQRPTPVPEQPRVLAAPARATFDGPHPEPAPAAPSRVRGAAGAPQQPAQAPAGRDAPRPGEPAAAPAPAPSPDPVGAVDHGPAAAPRPLAAAASGAHAPAPRSDPAGGARAGRDAAEVKPAAGRASASASAVAAPSAREAQRAAFEKKQGGAEQPGHDNPSAARKQPARAHAGGHEPVFVQAQGQPAAGPGPAPAAAPANAPRAPEQAGSGLASLPPSLAASVEADDSLRLVVLPNSANLRVTTPEGGDLSVHLRVRDGVTDVTVAGAGSEAAMAHSSDLRAALAGQGLTLGRIDRASAGAAAGTADVAGARARVRAGERGGERGSRVEGADESVNEVASPELARSLQ